MIKINIKAPSRLDLSKKIMAIAEKQITEKAQRAASPFGGVTIKFKYKPDGLLDSVKFEGTEEAIHAARHSIEN